MIPRRGWRRTTSATAAAVSLLAASLLPGLAPVAAATAATRLAAVSAGVPVVASTRSLSVALTSITPTVGVPKAPIRIAGSVRNSSGVWLTSPVARALIDQQALNSRQAVSDWATTSGGLALEEVARATVGATLAPGAVARFTLTIPVNAISYRQSFAVLALQIEVAGTTSEGTQRSGDLNTFLPALATNKEFVPLAIAWLFPLSLDPDPRLQGPVSAARTAAWTRAIGPGSRLDRLIQGTQGANVTWAIDPAILGPSQTSPAVDASVSAPVPTVTGSAPPTPGNAAVADPVTALTSALAQRLRSAAPRHTLWALPYADPDLAALLPLTSGKGLSALISHPSTLDVAVGPARDDIAWPVTGTLTGQAEARLRSAFVSSGLTAEVTSTSNLSHNVHTADASGTSASGLPLLAYDESLSRTVAQTSATATGAITTQRFLADSMTLLGERPGTSHRAVLIAEPRTFAGDPTVLRSLFAAVAKAPWLVPATTGELLAAGEQLSPGISSQGAGGSATPAPAAPTARSKSPDPMSPGTSPLSSDRLGTMTGTLSTIAGVASILGDGGVFASTWADAQKQELSARWRNHPGALAAIDAATGSAINTVSSSVRVSPSSLNFFADQGVMQVTVVNDLPVPIHDVHLTLTPAQPRLRIQRQAGPLDIGAKARATVPLTVTSIAAGLVDVKAALTTPNGTPLGENASIPVRVQPPATWIYWLLGVLAGVILVLGTLRSLRRGSTRASQPEAQEPPVDD